MEDELINRYFARISNLQEGFGDRFEKEEFKAKKAADGAKKFKRKALGFFGRKTIKTLEEMSQLLWQTGVALSVEEGRKLASDLVGGSICYTNHLCRYLEFSKVTNPQEEKRYRIEVVPGGYYDGEN